MESGLTGERMTAGGKSPHEVAVNRIQAERLSAISGIDARELAGRSVGELAERYRWVIDPELWWFKKICGRVVKADPVTGLEYPVPYATVDIYDVDCDFWGFFPEGWPWAWLFPIRCDREKLTSVVTDACGEFCFWVPRFDIDWIVRWRAERVCFPEFFVKPSLAKLIGELLQKQPIGPVDPNPPDPAALEQRLGAHGDLAAMLPAGRAASVLAASRSASGFGASTEVLDQLLSGPAFPRAVAPPLPSVLHGDAEISLQGDRLQLPIDAIDPARYHGPFLRCVEQLVPEWYPIFEAPDVSIEVTQEIAGSTVVIYDGAFDVPWGVDPAPPITLHASPAAIASQAGCPGPVVDPNTVGFQYVGLLPVSAPYAAGEVFNGSTGFATRINSPVKPPSGCCNAGDMTVVPTCPATSPFLGGELYLYAAVDSGATYYRITDEWAVGSGIPTPAPAAFSPPSPIIRTWIVPTPSGQVHIAPADAVQGWYPIQTSQVGWGGFTDMLMAWGGAGDGVHWLTLEFADAAMNPITLASPPAKLLLVVDNDAPTLATFTLEYQLTATPDPNGWLPFAPVCPLIHRAGAPVSLRFTVSVSESHLFTAGVGAGGCGGESPALTSFTSSNGSTSFRYTGPADTSWTFKGIYSLSANAPAGCYSFSLSADTRAFNPAGGQAGAPIDSSWCIDAGGPYIAPSITVAIID